MPKIQKVNGTTFEAVLPSGDRVEIGDREAIDFKPSLKLNRWGGECFIKVGLPTAEKIIPVVEAGKVKWRGRKMEARFYPLQPTTSNEMGGFEFEIILKEKPSTNQIIFDIQAQGLRFSYQPPLTQEEIDKGSIRPDNVVGSYAVYHISKKNNEYMTGKAFHIYRPLAEDALGNKTWCDIQLDKHIDPTSLTITIPQQFLDEASYPITIDPDFGYTSIGETWYELCYHPVSYNRGGSAWTMPASGTANYIRAYLKGLGSTLVDCKVFINQKDSGGAGTHGQIATKENLDCDYDVHWEEFTLSDEELTSAVVYILNIAGGPGTHEGEEYYVAGDENGAVASYWEAQVYASPESPWVVNPEGTTIDYSIYCNYTIAVTEKTGSDTGSGADAHKALSPISGGDTGSGADAKASGNPLAAYARSETGGGVDGHKAVAPQSAGETGSGVDALTALLGILARSETGLGTDAKLSLAVALIKADAGSGVEHILDRALVLISESGSGLDVSHLVKTLMLSDGGTAAENSYLHIIEGVRLSADSGSGVEASSLATLFQRDESGEGVESVAARALFSREPQMGAIDLARVITAAITGAETGTGAEASLVAFYQKVTESGEGAEASSLVGLFTGEDSGAGAEAITLLAAMVAQDTAVSVESVLSFFRKLIDSGQGEENLLLIGYVGRAMKLITYLRAYSDLVVYTKPHSDLKVYTSEVKQ